MPNENHTQTDMTHQSTNKPILKQNTITPKEMEWMI